jgi:hypothetical protein
LRDLVSLVTQRAEMFAAASDGCEFFTDLKTHHRQVVRLEADVAARIKSMGEDAAEGSADYQTHQMSLKTIHVISTVTGAYLKSGGYSTSLKVAIDEGLHYLRMEPFAVKDFKLPLFLTLQRHEMLVLQASLVKFWSLIDTDALVGTGFKPIDVEGQQRSYIVQKTTGLGESFTVYSSAEAEFKRFFDATVISDSKLHDIITAEVKECVLLVCFERVSASQRDQTQLVLECVAKAKDAANTMLNAFTQFECGLRLIDLAEATCRRQLRACDDADKLSGTVQNLTHLTTACQSFYDAGRGDIAGLEQALGQLHDALRAHSVVLTAVREDVLRCTWAFPLIFHPIIVFNI